MKKKLVGVLLTAAMAVSALAGCGSKEAAAPAESKAAEEKTETVQEATEEAEAAEGEEVLTVWCWDPNFNVYASLGAEYRNWANINQKSAKDWRWQPTAVIGFKTTF